MSEIRVGSCVRAQISASQDDIRLGDVGKVMGLHGRYVLIVEWERTGMETLILRTHVKAEVDHVEQD